MSSNEKQFNDSLVVRGEVVRQCLGVGIAQWLGRRTCGRGIECRQEQRENLHLLGQLSVLTFINSVSVPPPCYCSST